MPNTACQPLFRSLHKAVPSCTITQGDHPMTADFSDCLQTTSRYPKCRDCKQYFRPSKLRLVFPMMVNQDSNSILITPGMDGIDRDGIFKCPRARIPCLVVSSAAIYSYCLMPSKQHRVHESATSPRRILTEVYEAESWQGCQPEEAIDRQSSSCRD